VSKRRDAVVVGAGPNGLAAAIELARNGVEVLVVEGHDEIGGGTRTAELTLPGFHHDVCAAAHSFGPSSPFLSGLPLEDHGLTWLTPPVAVAHPFDDGSAVLLETDVAATVASLGPDGAAYRRVVEPFVDRFDDLAAGLLAPLVRPPRNPLLLARFGRHGVQSAERFARRFTTVAARGFFAGLASHGVLPLSRAGTTGAGLALGVAGHHNGWPIVRGGTHELTKAMASYLVSLGGRIETGRWIERLDEVRGAGAVLLDVTPAQLVALSGDDLPSLRRRRMEGWEYGPATFKVDFALSDPVPW
jgi:phytoene dehydrogenase-like protein